MNSQEKITYWISSAEHDLSTAETLFGAEKYDWCLFLGHLVLEKALKALWVKQPGALPPKTHNLLLLIGNHLKISDAQKEFFENANEFNIEARYPDEKQSFYQICTKEFATTHFLQIKEFFKWLKLQIQ